MFPVLLILSSVFLVGHPSSNAGATSSVVNSLFRFPLKIQFLFAHCICSTARLLQHFPALLEVGQTWDIHVQLRLGAENTSTCVGLGMEQENELLAACCQLRKGSGSMPS